MPHKQLIGALTLAILIPVMASGAPSTTEDSPLNRQALAVLRTSVATNSKSFGTLKPLTIDVCNKGAVTETVSGTASGGAVDIRVKSKSGAPGVVKELLPGVAHLHTAGTTTSFSYTFALRSTGELLRSFRVQWRSPNGAHSVIKKALAVVLYKRPQHLCA